MRFCLKNIFVAAALGLMVLQPAVADAKAWEAISGDKAAEGKVIAREQEVEVRTGRNTIIVTTTKPTQVKIFTILGQLLSAETVSGSARYHIAQHGVFIVKAGELTCKVAL